VTAPEPVPSEPDPNAGTAELQADIERTRAELGDTVNALTAKLDLKSRATHAAAETKDRIVEKSILTTGAVVDKATDQRGRIKPAIPLAALALFAAVAGALIWRRRR
jgi:Protein of unknown function (DUF3618)